MPSYDENDIVEVKNRQHRKKKLIKLGIFAFTIIIISVLYLTYDMWSDKIRGIGKQYSTIINSGTLAEGNFPIETDSEYNYQLKQTQDKIIMLSNAHIFFYNSDGVLMKKRQHEYNNAILQADNGKALIYENGGYNFCIEDEEGILFSNQFENNIMFARISPEGYSAVITTSDNYDCEIFIYNKKGNMIYQRKCTERVNDLNFTSESNGCVVSYIKAENGILVTSVQQINFTESAEKWTSAGMNTAGLNVFGYDDGAFVLGIDACGYINGNGQISSYYKYDGELAGGASENGESAVIINNDDRRKYIMILFKGNSTQATIIDLEQPAVDVTIHNGLAYVMCKEEIRAYNFNGELRSTAIISNSYSGFLRSNKYIFLKGYNKIDRIDYDS